MYNEELEALIDAALADGVLTDKEKQVLFKKAQSLGVDLDEFELVLEGRLAKAQKQQAEQKAAKQSTKFGSMKKCPSCGAPIQNFQTKCPECGYEFRDVEANATAKGLQKLLDDIAASDKSSGKSLLSVYGMDNATRRMVQAIKSYPVPNTKEDLLELLTLCKANAKMGGDTRDAQLTNAWKSKRNQVMAKAKIALKDDPDFIAMTESEKSDRSKLVKRVLIVVVVVALAAAAIVGISVRSCSENAAKNAALMQETTEKVESYLESGDNVKAAQALSFCKADVSDGETSEQYVVLVIQVANGLINDGDEAKASELYEVAVQKLGRYKANKLDSLAIKLGIKEEKEDDSSSSITSGTEDAASEDASSESVEEASAESVSDSKDWDAVLDSYEEYVNSYVRLMKKAQDGDMEALSEYADMLEKAERISSQLEDAGGELSSSQMARYQRILRKMTSMY